MSDVGDQRHEIDKIESVLGSASPGRAPVVVITGAAGTGKTFLLNETATLGERLGYRTLPVIDGSRPEAITTWRSTTAESFGTPTLVLIDNAHLTDPERLSDVIRTSREAANASFVLAGRSATAAAANRWIQPGAVGDVHVARLAGLSSTEACEMVADLAGAPPDPTLTALTIQTGGNPRWVEALISGLREERRLRVTGGLAKVPDCRIPHRLGILIRTCLDRLSPGCRQMLQIAAVQDGRIYPARISPMLPLLEEAAEAAMLKRIDQAFALQSELVLRVVRDTVPATIRSAVKSVCPSAARQQVREYPQTTQAPYAWSSLTEIERTIAQLVSQGLTNRQIASRIFLSPHTVNYHLRHIFRKLHIASRVELATIANDHSRSSEQDGA